MQTFVIVPVRQATHGGELAVPPRFLRVMAPRLAWNLAKQAAFAWSEDFAPSMGAALSYYTMFSIAPLLLIVIGVAGLFFGDEAVRGEVFAQLRGLMGDDGARAVQDLLQSADRPEGGGLAALGGGLLLLLGATTVFGELQQDLDRIWRAPALDKSGGLIGLLKRRLLSFGMILALAFLLMVSLVMSAAIAALGKLWGPWLGPWELVAHTLDVLVSLDLTTGVFALIYKLMPRVNIRWHDVWIGALVTALLFTIGKSLIGLYLGKSAIASAFGAAGSLAIVMVWVYYSAQIFLLGAEFTRVYARAHGSHRAHASFVDAATASRPVQQQPMAGPPAMAATLPARPISEARPFSALATMACIGLLAGAMTRLRRRRRP